MYNIQRNCILKQFIYFDIEKYAYRTVLQCVLSTFRDIYL